MSMALLRRSQIRMFETISILIIFFILLVIVIVFYAKVQSGSNAQKSVEYQQLRAIESMNKLLFLPELQCSRQNVDVYTCIDTLKLDALSSVMADQDNVVYYADLFGKSTVSITAITGVDENRTWTIYNRTEEGILTMIPVSLWDPVDDTFSMGLLKIRTG